MGGSDKRIRPSDLSSPRKRRHEAMSGWSLSPRCLSCAKPYTVGDGSGACKDCYMEAEETAEKKAEELQREIDDLKSKFKFLQLRAPSSSSSQTGHCAPPPFSDVFLVASDESTTDVDGTVSVPAHKAVLVSRSPVFKAMFEAEMEESISGTIKISDVTYDILRAFVNYLYTAEVCLDEQTACELLVLAEKYQVKHLKEHCENYLVSKLTWDNSISNYIFAHQQSAGRLREASLSIISDNMSKFLKTDEYAELVKKDPSFVVGIYEAHLARQVNTAAKKSAIS